MISRFKIPALVLAGLVFGLLSAEGLSAFFLPRPQIQKLPLIRLQADPFCGYRCRPDQKGFTLEAPASINHLGFRGPDRPVEKAPGVERIALLGDSFIFGQGVGDDKTLPVRLEQALNAGTASGKRYEVLNFGLSGYDTGHEVRALEHYGLAFKPDIAVICFFINDLFYIENYDFYPAMFKKNEKEFSTARWFWDSLLHSSRVLMTLWDVSNIRYLRGHEVSDVLDAYTRHGADPVTGPAQDGWNFTLARLKEFEELAKKNGFRPVLLIMPSPEEITRKQEAPYAEFLRGRARKLGLETVSLFGDWITAEKNPRRLLIPYNFHLSEEGNKAAANELAGALKSSKVSGVS